MALAIRLGKYPYTYLRTLIMKRNLLSKSDYDKILKMSPEEIGKYLEEFEYKKEVDELAMEYRGVELIERTLQKSLGNKFGKLLRISPQDLKLLIKVYQKRYDIYNIKVILRAKFSSIPQNEIRSHMSPVAVEKNDFFEKLIAQKTVEEAISALSFLDESRLRAALDHFRNNNSLVYIENALDRHYFLSVISQLTYLSTEGKVYRKFLLNEMDIINVKMLLRSKHENLGEQSIREMIVGFGSIKKSAVDRMTKSDISGIMKELESTQFREIFEKYKDFDRINFTDLELSLDKFLLEQSRKLVRQNPMTVDAILGYMFLKDIEVKNLTRIIKAKQLGLSEEFIGKTILI